jgi:uncharacterized protein YigE (DUF2233 family)
VKTFEDIKPAQPLRGSFKPRSRRRYRVRSPRFRAAILVVVMLLLGSFTWSFGSALTANNQQSVALKAVEWLRGHGGGQMLRVAENFWYTWHQPPKGGIPPKGAILDTKAATKPTTTSNGVPHLPTPANVAPFVANPLPGEGVWQPEGRTVGGVHGLYVTTMRPDPVHTSLVAGIAWMDPKLLSFTLFAGGAEPGGGPWPNMAPIDSAQAASLVAAFNSGFRMVDSRGGWYSNGRMADPLVNGQASFVIYTNGAANVVQWGQGQTVPSNIVSVRQNLSLIVNNGKITSGVYSPNYKQWGATVGNSVLVWRSGVGVTSDGAIVYAAGNGLSVATLAGLLQRAGAVRAMELDINSAWVDYFYFNPPNGGLAAPSNGTRLVYNMERPPQRYFEGTARDFIGVFARPYSG